MIGFDGTVFGGIRKSAPTVALHNTGDGPKTGSKFGITSCRADGQRFSRVYLSYTHIHVDLEGSVSSEQEVVRDVAPRLQALSKRGIKGIVVDSAIRGKDVTSLQREHHMTVVNYPHAASNPDGGAGKRLNETRVEKSHLRRVATHINDFGATCEHYIFAVGGEFVQVVMNGMGNHQLERLHHLRYEQRPNKRDGTRREYHVYRIACDQGPDFEERIALFHTSPTSTDPDANWGEYVRVYAPGTAAFKYLYGARNDTEARHADLKARVKHLPLDRTGQELRLLGAAIASNALSWQVHMEANGLINVIDDTA